MRTCTLGLRIASRAPPPSLRVPLSAGLLTTVVRPGTSEPSYILRRRKAVFIPVRVLTPPFEMHASDVPIAFTPYCRQNKGIWYARFARTSTFSCKVARRWQAKNVCCLLLLCVVSICGRDDRAQSSTQGQQNNSVVRPYRPRCEVTRPSVPYMIGVVHS